MNRKPIGTTAGPLPGDAVLFAPDPQRPAPGGVAIRYSIFCSPARTSYRAPARISRSVSVVRSRGLAPRRRAKNAVPYAASRSFRSSRQAASSILLGGFSGYSPPGINRNLASVWEQWTTTAYSTKPYPTRLSGFRTAWSRPRRAAALTAATPAYQIQCRHADAHLTRYHVEQNSPVAATVS